MSLPQRPRIQLRRRWRFRTKPWTSGMNVVGYCGDTSGIGEASRSTARAALSAGYLVSTVNIGTTPLNQWPPEWRATDHAPRYAISVVHDNVALAKDHPDNYAWASLSPWKERATARTVGYWYWEMSELPEEFWPGFNLVDEVWVPTRFVYDALLPHTDKPVVIVPPGVDTSEARVAPRSEFDLPDGMFLFLTMASVHSILERKNPLGVIDAFERAFGGHDDVGLVIKITDLHLRPDVEAALKDAAKRLPLFCISKSLSRSATLGLLSCTDAYVSLHRSEGFGLPIAEAMALGRPVIATAYSGNMDFTNSDTAYLVDYKLTELPDSLGVYKAGCHWADPDLDCAASQMRSVLIDDDRRQRVSRAGHAFVVRQFRPDSAAPVIRKRMRVLA